MQNIFGKHRQQRRGTAQQHGKQVERHGPQNRLALADENDTGENRAQGHGLARAGRMVIAQAQHEATAQHKQQAAGGVHGAGPGNKNNATQGRAANHRRLDAC